MMLNKELFLFKGKNWQMTKKTAFWLLKKIENRYP
jgi:hypothetical protein